jgi:flagellar basal body-associated protein FliL
VAALAYAEKDRKLSKNIENRKPERKNIIVRLVFVVLFAEGAFTRSLVT